MSYPETIPESTLQRLGAALTDLLDDDQWNNIEKNYLIPALAERETLVARADYLTVCPDCGEGPSETGFPRMDEDGCCASCGSDCSIAGLVDASEESKMALSYAQTVLESVKDRMDEHAYQELASALNP